MYEHAYYSLSILLYRVDWKLIRLIWIAFYKNEENNACFIDRIPKDVVKHIIKFIGIPRHAQSDGKMKLANFALQL